MARLNDIPFADLYLTPEGEAFVPGEGGGPGLRPLVEAEDLQVFRRTLETSWRGKSSYAVFHDGVIYRVERVEAFTGIHYSVRRVARATPDLRDLRLPEGLVRFLFSLGRAYGLVLWAGPTGEGKTTAICSLLKAYLERHGGFAYTIEDPPELPLDGTYRCADGGLGLCKQTEPTDGNWAEGLKSALRSRPRYILVGEIRQGSTASEVLRAATSGHLVLSTVHGNGVDDALASIVKYATASEMDKELATDLLARGLLGVIHQRLLGTRDRWPQVRFVFANPDRRKADPVRALVREGRFDLGTQMDAQTARMLQGMPLVA